MSKRTVILAVALVALASCGGGKSAAPKCNGESPVWAIAGTKAYLTRSDPHYGKTKYGRYVCPSEARAEGLHHARRHSKGHHRRAHD